MPDTPYRMLPPRWKRVSPGTKFSYSTNGYTVVGCVIEGASGVKYVDFVHENVLRPAGMTNTRADDYSAIIPFRTRFYSKDVARL